MKICPCTCELHASRGHFKRFREDARIRVIHGVGASMDRWRIYLRSRGERNFMYRGTLAGGPRGHAEARRGKHENVPVHVRASRVTRAFQEVSRGQIGRAHV